MVEIDYLSNRGNRVITREGDVVAEQFPGDKRRFVIERPIGKRLKFELPSNDLEQQREPGSKWTSTGDIVAVRGFTLDCPECGTECPLRIDGVSVETSSFEDNKYVSGRSSWKLDCENCGNVKPQSKPDEPAWPKPNLDDQSDILHAVQDYAAHVNDEIFNGEIDLDRLSWTWNSRNTNTAGRAWSYKIELTPQYLDANSWNDFLQVVRHELIHVWEHHAGNDRAGHNGQFHDWIVDANTRRHCSHF